MCHLSHNYSLIDDLYFRRAERKAKHDEIRRKYGKWVSLVLLSLSVKSSLMNTPRYLLNEYDIHLEGSCPMLIAQCIVWI